MSELRGIIAVTDRGWFEFLSQERGLDEVNFWKPSSRRGVRAAPFTPFLFKLRAPDNAICGFGYFARYSRLPAWLAWETFGPRQRLPFARRHARPDRLDSRADPVRHQCRS